jgi:hypothetical protein
VPPPVTRSETDAPAEPDQSRGHCHINPARPRHAAAVALAMQRQRPPPTCQRSQREAA